MRRLRSLLFQMFLLAALAAKAQMWDSLATTSYRIVPSSLRQLRVEVDNLSFFRDNEYSSSLTKGYSLPGLWVQPKLTYVPLSAIKLELGLHALVFNGANKYPCYVYHDIATWKGNQYQKGAHVLPWVRAQAQFKHLTVVLGNLYGGQQHGFTDALWNAEANLSQDPEMGFQLLWDRPRLHADTWLNWQSYIYEEDTHQEAFTVGSTWRIHLGDTASAFQWHLPVQLVVQHRGGEQDLTEMGVQTISNAYAGIAFDWLSRRRALTQLGAEVGVQAAYQQSGTLWPFDTGLAVSATARATLWNHLGIRAGYFFAPDRFVSLYGHPFFSTVSIRDHQSYSSLSTAWLHADYHHTFARDYVLGVGVEAYQCWLGESAEQTPAGEFNFSFGIYLRLHPSLLIKQFR